MRGWLQLKVLKYEFEDVYITSYSSGPGPGGVAAPIEAFVLNFKKMTYHYS